MKLSKEQKDNICFYGCGQKATYHFKNGKWCCSKNYRRCPGSNGINHPMFGKKHSIKTLNKMRETKKGKKSWNKGLKCPNMCGDKNPSSRNEVKEKISKSNKFKRKLSINQILEKYPTFSKIEKMRYNPNKPLKEKVIQVHCKNHNCKNSEEQGGWFTPTYIQLFERIRHIENVHGTGGSYLYCSKKCKEECLIYGKTPEQLIKIDLINSGYIEEPWYTSQEYYTWRNKVFELDNNKCVYCEIEAEHAHHILPQKTHPELSLDPENGLSCCKNCHYKYGHKGECSTYNLSKLICKRIYKIKKKQ